MAKKKPIEVNIEEVLKNPEKYIKMLQQANPGFQELEKIEAHMESDEQYNSRKIEALEKALDMAKEHNTKLVGDVDNLKTMTLHYRDLVNVFLTGLSDSRQYRMLTLSIVEMHSRFIVKWAKENDPAFYKEIKENFNLDV